MRFVLSFNTRRNQGLTSSLAVPYVTGSDQPKNELIGEHHEDDDWHNPPPDLPVPIHGLRNQIIHGAHSTARNLIPTGRRAYSKSRNLIPAGRRFKASARPTAEPSEEGRLYADSFVKHVLKY